MFAKEDWVEIYYAVRDKYENGRAVSQDREWKAHMKEILEKLGPDGKNMSAEGEEVVSEERRTPKVLIWMEGGLIQSIDASQEVEVVVIDEDTEGGDPENIKTIKLFGDNEKETDFYITDWGTIELTPECVEYYFNEARKERPKPKEEGAPGGDIPAQE